MLAWRLTAGSRQARGIAGHDEDYTTRARARASHFESIEVFYANKRLHSVPGYVTPAAEEQSR